MQLITQSEKRADHVVGHLRTQGFEQTAEAVPTPGFFSYARIVGENTFVVRWVAYVPTSRHLEALKR